MLLLSRECVSAPELAARFEVSVRTIYRDIEALCEAGIPVAAYPGAGGGFGILRGYKLDRSVVAPNELGQAAATLESLSDALDDRKMSGTADKLKALAPRGMVAGKPVPENYVFIELAPAKRERDKIGLLRRSIEERRVIRFRYIDSKGIRSERGAEPDALVFTWHAWYLYAFCRERYAPRLFKIARIEDLKLEAERFEPHDVDLDSRPWNSRWAETEPFLPCVIRFHDAARVRQHFDESMIQVDDSGRAVVRTHFSISDWAVSFLLGLGIPFEILEPIEFREFVASRARGIVGLNS